MEKKEGKKLFFIYSEWHDTNRVLEFVQKLSVWIETHGLGLLVIISRRMWNILDKKKKKVDAAEREKKNLNEQLGV